MEDPTIETSIASRGIRKVMLGTVISTKMMQTISVKVERRLAHPRYKKYYNRSKKFLVHDPENSCREGDLVRIVECRPLSRHKRFRLLDVVRRKL
ncbi:MAG: 30S ribosomal protein S17 [Candidatus Electryoneaceae bacterium]|nr:30S ribosomal protein S17 [Candidatus Electryoneaceae bacterium]